MKISITHNSDTFQETLLLPVVAGSHLSQSLQTISSQTGVSESLLKKDFQAEQGETQILYGSSGRVVLLGLGKKTELSEIIKTFRSFSFKCKSKLSSRLSISFLYNNVPEELPLVIEACMNGLFLGTYQIGRFKSTNGKPHPFTAPETEVSIQVAKEQKEVAEQAAKKGLAMAKTQISIFDLVNAPNNKKLPEDLGSWAKASGKKYGYQVEVLEKPKIEKLGLDALLAVNRGSEHPPVFIIMEYKPAQPTRQPLKKIGLVGKGVTFDTGGLSIKPSSNMHYMKSDMGGAAAVFGTMEMAAKLQLPIHLVGIVPATDNSVDGKAIKPSDVINSYSGKTIEIIDTDAEGRLILADGLAYMVKHFQPETIIDLATLTGSTVRTFGYHAAGLFSNDNQLAGKLCEISMRTGEKVWQLPIWDVYKEDIKSDVADIRNFSGKPMAGAIGAAKFLEFFISDHPSWAHLDIAGVAFNDSEFTAQKSATAFGVRLLTEFLIEKAKPK